MEKTRVHPYPSGEQLLEVGAYDTPGGVRVVVIPGSAIMERHWLSAAVLVVRCPGCGASQTYSRATMPARFVHTDNHCPIRRRIEAAVAKKRALLREF